MFGLVFPSISLVLRYFDLKITNDSRAILTESMVVVHHACFNQSLVCFSLLVITFNDVNWSSKSAFKYKFVLSYYFLWFSSQTSGESRMFDEYEANYNHVTWMKLLYLFCLCLWLVQTLIVMLFNYAMVYRKLVQYTCCSWNIVL